MSANGRQASGWRTILLVAVIGATVGFGVGVEYGSRSAKPPVEESSLSLRANTQATLGADSEYDAGRGNGIASQAAADISAEQQSTKTAEPAGGPASATSQPGLVSGEDDDAGGRCTAITKAGTRCKRRAQEGRDRCWQHSTP